MKPVLRLHVSDDVAVALDEIEPGEPLILIGEISHRDGETGLEARERIPFAHKIALRELAAGERVLKFGWPIGRMTANASSGALVHVHNLATERGR